MNFEILEGNVYLPKILVKIQNSKIQKFISSRSLVFWLLSIKLTMGQLLLARSLIDGSQNILERSCKHTSSLCSRERDNHNACTGNGCDIRTHALIDFAVLTLHYIFHNIHNILSHQLYNAASSSASHLRSAHFLASSQHI
jgi:hypothetical protein